MALEGWTLIAQAVNAGLLLGGGFYLRYLIKHQMDAKDATIETLKTKLDVVERERAPEIVKDLRVLEEYAEKATSQKNRLNEELQKLTEKQKKDESYRPILQLKAEIDGLAFASNLLSKDIIEGLQQVTGESRSCTNLDIDKIPTSTFLMKFINTNSTLQKRIQERLAGLRQNITTLEQSVEAQAE
jgi:gas vesicle protein